MAVAIELQELAGGGKAHPTAEVSERAAVGAGTVLWRNVHVREDARVGRQCNIGAGVYVGAGVTLGDRCKVQNDALLYEGLTLEDGVFIGPQVCFTNDYWPRAINPDGTLKAANDWDLGRTIVRYGASVGARAVIITGIEIGAFAMIGAGSVVTRAVPAHGLVFGAPAKLQGWVCSCGQRLQPEPAAARGWCVSCAGWTALPALTSPPDAAPPRSHPRPRLRSERGRKRQPAAIAQDALAARLQTSMRCRTAEMPGERSLEGL